MKTTRCTQCRAEFTDVEIKGANACPKCGTESLPMDMKEDVTVTINWHELRILGMWAENWAGQCDKADDRDTSTKTVVAITTALEKQHPMRTPLSLRREVQQLNQHLAESHPGTTAELVEESKSEDGK